MTTSRPVASPRRQHRRRSKGQVMVIFALMATLLFAIIGLAVDAGVSYVTYNDVERAAAAAALAAAPYMPGGFGGVAHCSLATGADTVDLAACSAAARNGFPDQGTVNGHSVTVSESRYPSGCVVGSTTNPCADNKLTVSITAWAQSTFIRVLGFGDHQVTASDTAFYLPPISIGQPGAQLGSSLDQLGSGSNYYFLRSEGFGTFRGEGDAYDPYQVNANISCQQSITENPSSYGSSTDTHALSQNNNSDVPNSTLTAAGYNALPTRGGYDFSVVVPTGVTGYVRVYNPAFSPDGGFNPGSNSQYDYHEEDGDFSGNSYTDQYSAMEYTLYQVNDIFDHTKDTPISQIIVDPLNITVTSGAVASITDVDNGQTLSPTSHAAVFNYIVNNIYHSWVDIGNPPTASVSWTSGGTAYSIFKSVNALSSSGLAAGRYRLRVDMLDYQGLRPLDDGGASECSRAHKGYALQLSTKSGSTYSECANSGCQISAIDELAVYTPIIATTSTGFDIPLFALPSDYAGQTVDFYVYDVGDVSGPNQISILDPDQASCGAAPAPCTFTSSQGVPVYMLGNSRNVTPTNSLLVQNQFACATTPAVQPNADSSVINTVPPSTNNWNSCNNGDGGTGTSPPICGGQNLNDFYDGCWLMFQLNIPANYGGANGAYWEMQYSLAGTSSSPAVSSDTFTLVVNYSNTPVHLLP